MKKIFQLIALGSLVIACFIYSEKTMLVVREYDDIMIKIKENKKEVKPIEPIIKNNTIIPGLSGYKIDINKSYLKMKEYGKYNDNLLVYKKVLPKKILKDHKDKYIISGNKSKKMVSLVLLVDNKYIDKIPSNIKLNLFPKQILDNYENYNERIKGYYKYDDWLRSTYKANHMKVNYCFIDKECFKNNLYVIKSDVIKNNYLLMTKKSLMNGSIIVYEVNNSFLEELNLIINYINSKGYEIVYLEELLKE